MTVCGACQLCPLRTVATHLGLPGPALYLEIRAIDRGTDQASSQRFSYFGSLAVSEEGDDGACAKQTRIGGHSQPDTGTHQGETPPPPSCRLQMNVSACWESTCPVGLLETQAGRRALLAKLTFSSRPAPSPLRCPPLPLPHLFCKITHKREKSPRERHGEATTVRGWHRAGALGLDHRGGPPPTDA